MEGDATALPKGGMRSWGAYHVSQSAPCGGTPCADPKAQQPAAEGTTPEDMVGCFAACLLPSALLRTRRCASPPLPCARALQVIDELLGKLRSAVEVLPPGYQARTPARHACSRTHT